MQQFSHQPLYRQWSCSNVWQGCKEPVQSCTNEDTENELSYGAILSTYLRRTQEKNCCPSNQAFKLQIRSYSHCPLRQICHFFSLLATLKCVCVWQSHVLNDKHRSSEHVQPTNSSHVNPMLQLWAGCCWVFASSRWQILWHVHLRFSNQKTFLSKKVQFRTLLKPFGLGSRNPPANIPCPDPIVHSPFGQVTNRIGEGIIREVDFWGRALVVDVRGEMPEEPPREGWSMTRMEGNRMDTVGFEMANSLWAGDANRWFFFS